MGQTEVLEWLKKQRLELGNEQYFTVKEVALGMNHEVTPDIMYSLQSYNGSLTKLRRSGEIEWIIGGSLCSWLIRHRYKLKK